VCSVGSLAVFFAGEKIGALWRRMSQRREKRGKESAVVLCVANPGGRESEKKGGKKKRKP